MSITYQKTVEIYCHTCNGEGAIYENHYPDFKRVPVICPECKGKKYIIMLTVPTSSLFSDESAERSA
jgi:DnaJ-class molecular chaperone